MPRHVPPAEHERRKRAVEDALKSGAHPFNSPVSGTSSAVGLAAKSLGLTAETLTSWVRRQGESATKGRPHYVPDWSLFQQAPAVTVIDTPEYRREIKDAEYWRRRATDLQKQLTVAEHALEEVAGMMARPATPPAWVVAQGSAKRNSMAGLLHLSDFHAGEVVRPEEIGGLNEYNPDIFVRRIRRAFAATTEILPRWSADGHLVGICVAINGDLVSGDIHDELRRTNALTAHEQVYLVTDEICAGLKLLADAFGHVMAVFTPGNHGRTTEKTHAKRVSALSYDTLIGEQVRRYFDSSKSVDVIIASGPDAVYPILGWTVFQSHGDALGSGGGKGFAGVILPIARGAKSVELQAARVRRHYDIILTAHYHTSANPGAGVLANGSVVGYGEYANRIRANVEVPQQWLALIHSKWCLRERCEIKLEDPTIPELPRVRVPARLAERA
jgi:hypothetical protein